MNDSRSAYHRISDLSKRIDQEATYELVDLFQSPDPGIRLEAARALCGRHIPPVVRERVIEPLFSDRFNDGAATDNLMYIALRCASQTVLQQPAATAFDVVECLLQTNKLNEPLPRARVEAILNAVEERLCFCFTLPASSRELPDRRFWMECDRIRHADRSFDYLAGLVIDGFRYFDGEAVEPAVVCVELGEGEEYPFPFLIAGFDVSDRGRDILEGLRFEHPRGLCWFEHQYGGLACMHRSFLGYGLALPDRAEIQTTIQALTKKWVNTYSETMLEKEGIEWTERLRTLLGGEAEFVYGAEALLIAAVVPPLESILGLDVFHFAAGLPPWSRYVDVSQGNDFIAPDASYSRHHENALSIISRALNLENPSIVIVWGNSD